MSFPTDGWRKRLVDSVNEDERFDAATEQFDGSVTLEIGDDVGWFKLYRGTAIDTEPYVPSFGSTYRLVGEQTAWQQLVDGEASLSEQLYAGRLRTVGNRIEANRMREATELLVRHLRRQEGEQA